MFYIDILDLQRLLYFIIIIIVILYLHLKCQHNRCSAKYKIIQMASCQKSWPPIITFTNIVNIQTFTHRIHTNTQYTNNTYM